MLGSLIANSWYAALEMEYLSLTSKMLFMAVAEFSLPEAGAVGSRSAVFKTITLPLFLLRISKLRTSKLSLSKAAIAVFLISSNLRRLCRGAQRASSSKKFALPWYLLECS